MVGLAASLRAVLGGSQLRRRPGVTVAHLLRTSRALGLASALEALTTLAEHLVQAALRRNEFAAMRQLQVAACRVACGRLDGLHNRSHKRKFDLG